MNPNNIKNKICIISPSLKMGGIEKSMSVLANYFVNQGYGVSFITVLDSEKFYSLNAEIQIFEHHLIRRKGVLSKMLFYFSVQKFIRKTVKNEKPDVVLSFGDIINPLVLLALLGTKFPVYISDRTSPNFPFNLVVQWGKKWLYPKSAGFIAQTQRAANYKKFHFKDKLNIKIIPNAINEVKIIDVPKLEQIVCVGRLSLEKGQDRLVKAFSKIAATTNWKLVLAGYGPMQEELEKMAHEMQLEDKIIFLGKVQNVEKLLQESSIFVLPSRLEGFPNALCEAMALGLPCICFDSIPTEALISSNKNGIVVKENDIEGLASAMKTLIDDPSLRTTIGNNAKKIIESLEVSFVGEEYLDFMFQRKK